MRKRTVRNVLLAFVVLLISAASFGQLRISVSFGPPALPIYEQPLCPGDGYIWTPGYWAWSDDDDDYYWVPGTWVLAPEVGYLWTPPYWAWNDGAFVFYDGYWGPHVGFYGGIHYGFGYFGEGFEGGRWDNGRFFYNRSVTNVNITNVHNVYNTTVVNNTRNVTRISYNGGNGGISARPTPQDLAAARDRHLPPPPIQTQHVQAARSNRELLASANHGKPPVAATARPGAFSGREAVPARQAGAPYNPPANRRGAQPRTSSGGAGNANGGPGTASGHTGTAYHPRDLPPMDRPAPVNTGNARRDQKYQQQQQKLQQKQDQERQKLQQQQERDHQRLSQKNSNDARRQQTEQRHQQQTQQLQQRHEQQQRRLQQRQAPPQPRQENKPPQRTNRLF
jgi:WXXGXW repeat (2 copies)